MDKAEIISDIIRNRGTEIASLQLHYGIAYKDAKSVVEELVSKGDLMYDGGVWYKYVGKEVASPPKVNKLIQMRKAERDAQNERKKNESDDDVYDIDKEIQEFLEELNIADDDDEPDDCVNGKKEADSKEKSDEEELRYKALEICIEDGAVSFVNLMRKLQISYVRASELVKWMENEHYVSKQEPYKAREVLITRKKLDMLRKKPYYVDVGDVFSDGDKADDEEKKIERVRRVADILQMKVDNVSEPYRYTPIVDPKRSAEYKGAIQNLSNVLSRIADAKNAPISADKIPSHSLWTDKREFYGAVMARIETLVKSDKRMGLQGAVKKAESYLEAVRDTHDGKMVQVYERLVYEMKNTSEQLYRQLKKTVFDT